MGLKCEKCEDLSQIPKREDENEILSNSSFPFEQGKYYTQKRIRNLIGQRQRGISYNKKGDYWVLIKNKKNNKNTYEDRIDKDGFYQYTGEGLLGDQSYDNPNNSGLKNAESKRQKIHLFWQDNHNSDHKYIGEVKVIKIDNESQYDVSRHLRNVIMYTLQPVE